MGYTPLLVDLDIQMKPGLKDIGFIYWQYILCYVNDILCINHDLKRTLQQIQAKFKLKDDKMKELELYLSAEMSKIDNEHWEKCQAISSDKYCGLMVKNIKENLAKKGLRLPLKCTTPLKHGYKLELDCTSKLKAEGLH